MKERRRPDGYPGEHFVVLPEPERVRAGRHPLLRGLHVTDAGYFPHAQGHWVERPTGASTTLALLCLRGGGEVRLGEAIHAVGAGDWAWLPAREPHAYGTRGTEPWTIAWAHFAGDEVPAWRELLMGAGTARAAVISLAKDRLEQVALDQVFAALERGYALREQVAAAAALRNAFSAVAQLALASTALRSSEERVLASVEQLQRDWQRPHRLEELATAAGVSVTHYSMLFRRHTGFAPIDYLIRLRVRHACHLLDTTRLAVGAIAERVGYADAYYFTRCFRRVMGCAPRTYRNIPKG